jgi:hypothetical protein
MIDWVSRDCALHQVQFDTYQQPQDIKGDTIRGYNNLKKCWLKNYFLI